MAPLARWLNLSALHNLAAPSDEISAARTVGLSIGRLASSIGSDYVYVLFSV